MDIATASAISTYGYQATSASSGQAKAVLQALTQAYSSGGSVTGGGDPLAALVGNSNLGPLVSALYSTAKAVNPTSGNPLAGLTASPSFGGLESGSASSLLATLASGSGLGGFDAALNASSDLAIAAYQSAANKPKPPEVPAGTTAGSSYVQQLLQASQSATQTATFNLLG